MNKLFLGLGSNLNNPKKQLERAFGLISESGFKIIQCSSFYQSPPMANMEQPDYVNAVCLIETKLTAIECLNAFQRIELLMGRKRDKKKWQARKLDLDIILFNQEVIKTQRLTVPHYGMLERAFVIEPLLEIVPECRHPLFGSLKKIDSKSFKEQVKKL